jgi:hypothetical protein
MTSPTELVVFIVFAIIALGALLVVVLISKRGSLT